LKTQITYAVTVMTMSYRIPRMKNFMNGETEGKEKEGDHNN
jgi:hypothetical protein